MKKLFYIPIAVFTALTFAPAAQAQIIYSDPLTEYSSGTLNGDTVPSGSGAGTAWTAAGSYTTSSSGASTSTFAANAYLPFTLAAGNVYTLQATLVGTDGTFGFGTNVGTSSFAIFNSPSALIRIYPGLDDTVWMNGSSTADSGQPTTARPSGDPLDLTVTLNTTGANWTASFSVVDTDVPSNSWTSGPIAYGTNPTAINNVFFSSGGNPGTWSDLSLSTPAVSTPEPATGAMILIGGVWLVAGVVLRRSRSLLRNP